MHENCIIFGDFNFVTSILDRSSNTLNSVDKQTSETWQNFENNFELQDAFRLTNPKRRIYSFFSKVNKQIRSRIDRMFISTNISGKVISSAYIATNLSDHKIYKTIFSPEVEIGMGLWVFNNQLLLDETFSKRLIDIIEAHINANDVINPKLGLDI